MDAAGVKDEPQTYKLTAVNFAEDSSNKIHDNDVARDYGFKGGLVPGIAVYAYMTHPVVERLGSDWMQRGTITAKFIKPIYADERVSIEIKQAGSGTNEFEIQAFNADRTLCAVGSAGVAGTGAEIPSVRDYPRRPLPAVEGRIQARAANLPPGTPLGTLDFSLAFEEHESKVLHYYLDKLPLYRGAEAAYHPAYLLEQANQILMQNVSLGPWMHIQSAVQNFSCPGVHDALSIRGCVTSSYVKRGHEMVDLDLAIFDPLDRGITRVRHTAIIRLKSPVSE